MTLGPGTRLGPYEILAPLGAGGMGEVYRARDTRLGREVALKVVAARHGDAPEALRRFAREAKIAARLTHPNVCTLFDADTDGEVAYFVMELLEGETLASRIARGPIAEEEARRIGADVARGLARAHELGFVHRDLKPQNVFLTATGAKILDFGLARSGSAGTAAEEEATASLLTEAGHVLGTAGYMAPEQLRGEPPAAAADLWALGCVLFECLSGRRAFSGRTAQETFASTLSKPPDFAALPPNVLPELRALLERLLEKDPISRLSDAAAVAQILSSGTLTTAPVPAPPNSRRRHVAVGLAALVALLAAGAALWFLRGSGAPIDSLAVLPFSSTGSDADLADVCASLSEGVLARISQAPNLRVMASGAVERFSGAHVDALAAARELGVRAVLTGRAVGRAGRVVVSTELVDARDGRRLWGERYERPLAQIASLPTEISAALAARLRLHLSGPDRARLARKETENGHAYELWLSGRQRVSRRTESDLGGALVDFQKAIDADPQFARAWAGVAQAWDILGYTGRRPTPEAFERSKAAARKALELDPDLADAHAVLAHATFLTGDAKEAERGFKRAIELDANNVSALHWYSHLLVKQKRWDESLAMSKRLLELDPMGYWNVHLGEHYRAKGERALALEQFRRAVELDANLPNAQWELGRFLLEEGRVAEALPHLETAHRLDPEAPQMRQSLADAYERSGRPADAARLRARAAPATP
ncbi:MAG: protein kinase [Acidobacteria bacterium]|nr:protein kinase [Acidobacteriota bacterium]